MSVLMTAYADLDAAIGALRAGASDFLRNLFRWLQVVEFDPALFRAF